ncbi:TonB-dependent siderophore receptor [Aliiglaciecola sp. 2_MG-2023]|uniref:TonB-dependent siderophore receptor n=1 Tax=unclassified Aliiglaciecola TaxID=2593648 RepID=UPI0026E2C209|nr:MULTISPECIES: TonB-dependent siderophore receptor [unclassified Aliiglaciecola]MDO6711561.1 TonB-dependent siderophore receptor [Aliiglaciecola sp. 2_MG-2023]MDO6752632.1 TonB-dependent siderophore receptor [Aliiglaciecola sp. 1_MG-2023]
MNKRHTFALSPLMLALGMHAQAADLNNEDTNNTAENDIEVIRIVESRIQRISSGATGLGLDSFDTPQSLSIIENDTISKYNLSDINSLFRQVTGINIDQTETDRTYFNARGFDITSMHVDGSGIPFGDIFVGDLDTAIYEKVEFIRGSNGLITGLGNPSGTVNYVRKRPSNDPQASVAVTLGRWSNMRAVVDVSTPLTESGSWAARAVVVHQDKQSWLDRYENNRTVVYGVVDGQINDDVTLTFGYTYQDNNSDGVTWGAVPMIYSDGTQTDFAVSESTSMNWTYWDTLNETAFAELSWYITDDLNFTSKLNYTKYEDNSELFYAYSNTGLDHETGLGMLGYPGKFYAEDDILIWDNTLQGTFQAWGMEHSFNLGVSLADSETLDLEFGALSGFDVMPALPGWTGTEVARPDWAEPYQAGYTDVTLNRFYGSIQLAVTENFDFVLGASFVDYENEGESWGASTSTTEDGTSPYIGFTWEAMEGLNVYSSYSDIYQPQYYLNEDLEPLGSAEGRSYEMGIKKRFEHNLLVSLAVFRTEQENLYEFIEYGDGDGVDDDDYSDDFDYSLYRGVNVDSNGFELEVSGQVSEEWTLQGGFTALTMDDENGDEARTFIPRRTLKLMADYSPTWQEKLNAGISVRWQSEMYYQTGFGRITQDAYALIGGYVQYRFSEQVSLSLNLDNITDEKYLSSVRTDQAFYGSPTDYSLTLRWGF